jgi:Ca2+-binding RTX toxin-like protein
MSALGSLAALVVIGAQAAQAGPIQPTCFGMTPTIVGAGGDVPIVGTPGDDVIYVPDRSNPRVDALAGDDLVCAPGAGTQDVHGGDGADQIDAGPDHDPVYGDAGDDVLIGGGGVDVLYPGPGEDAVQGSGHSDAVAYDDATNPVWLDLDAGTADGNGLDTLTGITEVLGSPHGDKLVGDEKGNFFDGAAGNDKIAGGRGIDSAEGGPGNDQLVGGRGKDYLKGEGGRDRIVLGGARTPHGGAAFGGSGPDVLIGSPARDRLYGGSGADEGFGRQGRDRCREVEKRNSCVFVAPFGA